LNDNQDERLKMAKSVFSLYLAITSKLAKSDTYSETFVMKMSNDWKYSRERWGERIKDTFAYMRYTFVCVCVCARARARVCVCVHI